LSPTRSSTPSGTHVAQNATIGTALERSAFTRMLVAVPITCSADPSSRAKLYGDLQAKLADDVPAAFLVATSEHLLLNKRVSGEEGPGWLERLNFVDVDVPAE